MGRLRRSFYKSDRFENQRQLYGASPTAAWKSLLVNSQAYSWPPPAIQLSFVQKVNRLHRNCSCLYTFLADIVSSTPLLLMFLATTSSILKWAIAIGGEGNIDAIRRFLFSFPICTYNGDRYLFTAFRLLMKSHKRSNCSVSKGAKTVVNRQWDSILRVARLQILSISTNTVAEFHERVTTSTYVSRKST